MSSLELSLRHAPSGAFCFQPTFQITVYFLELYCPLILGQLAY